MKCWYAPLIVLSLMLAGCQSTGSLGGTSWTVEEVLAADENDIIDMDIHFGTNGEVTTTTTHEDGTREVTRHPYAVHGALISTTRRDGELNALHRIEGAEMILTAENFQARLRRLN